MWLEVKAMFSVIAIIFAAIVLSQIIMLNMLLGFLLIVTIGMIVIGDLFIGHKITSNHLDVLMNPVKADEEICILFTLSGMVDFVKTRKGPLGTRQFVYHKKEATIINDGSYPIRFVGGQRGFVGHENFDRNVDLYKAEALSKTPGNDVKEIFQKIKNREGVKHYE